MTPRTPVSWSIHLCLPACNSLQRGKAEVVLLPKLWSTCEPILFASCINFSKGQSVSLLALYTSYPKWDIKNIRQLLHKGIREKQQQQQNMYVLCSFSQEYKGVLLSSRSQDRSPRCMFPVRREETDMLHRLGPSVQRGLHPGSFWDSSVLLKYKLQRKHICVHRSAKKDLKHN